MPSTKNHTSSREIAKLLLSGATMLDQACPDCHVPLFRKQSKIFCPNCKREAFFVSSEEEMASIETSIQTKQLSSNVFSNIKPILYGKLEYFARKIADSTDPDEINSYLSVIQNIMMTLQSFNKEQKK